MSKIKSIILNLSLPRKWSDLTSEQVMQLAYLISRRYEREECLLRFALFCGGLKPHGSKVRGTGQIVYYYYRRGVGNIPLTAAQLASVRNAVAWVLDEPSLMAVPLLTKRFKSPDALLYGVTLEQYLIADGAYGRYTESHNVRDLELMAATLFCINPYSDSEVTKLMPRTKVIADWQLEAVALWWLALKKWFTKKYFYVFKASETGGGGVSDPVETFFSVLCSLNEGRIADNEVIRRTDVHEALHQLNVKAKSLANSKNRKK